MTTSEKRPTGRPQTPVLRSGHVRIKGQGSFSCWVWRAKSVVLTEQALVTPNFKVCQNSSYSFYTSFITGYRSLFAMFPNSNEWIQNPIVYCWKQRIDDTTCHSITMGNFMIGRKTYTHVLPSATDGPLVLFITYTSVSIKPLVLSQ